MARLLILVLAAMALLPGVALGQQEGTSLFAELVVNGRVHPDLVEINAIGEALWIEGSALAAIGLDVAPSERVDVAHDPRFVAIYEPLRLRLALTVDVAMLPVARHGRTSDERIVAESGSGFVVNYDASIQIGGGGAGGLWSEQRRFSPAGSLSNSGVLRFGGSVGKGYLRYDTQFRRVDATRAVQLVMGDMISSGLDWIRAYRMGGIQIGRAWRIRPDLVTMPLPSFAGEAAVPSAVDLYIDGQRQQQRVVDPGRFVLQDQPVITGAGNAQVVTTDAIGRQIATDIPFYVAPDMLATGLTDFGAQAGFIRRRYGLSSFSYGMAAASGFWRHGWTDRLTIEAQGEVSTRSAAGGVGVVWTPGLFGSFNGNATLGVADSHKGRQWSAGYSYISRRWSLTVDHRRASRGFRSIADLDSRSIAVGGWSTRAFATANFERGGTAALGYIDVRPARGDRARLATLSWSLPIGQRMSGFAGADYDLDRGRMGLQFRVTIALGNASVGTGIRRNSQHRMQFQAEFGQAVPYAGGIGGNAGLVMDSAGIRQGQGTLVVRADHVQATGGVAFVGNRTVGLGGLTGSVIMMDGDVHLANGTSSAFALVSTDGVEGIPVRYENQVVGVTNRRGHVFVPQVTPYHAARYSIDPVGLDADFIATAVERRTAIVEGTGAIIRMPVRRSTSVTLGLIDALGTPIEAGSTAHLAGTALPVGWDGVVFVPDAIGKLKIIVDRRDGGSCTVELKLPSDRTGMQHIGGVSCE